MSEILTKVEVAKMIRTIRSIYPNYNNNMSKDEAEIVADVWLYGLKEYPKAVIIQAFYNMIKTCKSTPTFAHLIEQIELIQDAGASSSFELEKQLKTAISEATRLFGMFNNTGVDYGETKSQAEIARENLNTLFENLHPVIKAYAVNVNGLLELGDNDWKFERNRFLEAIPYLKSRIKIQKQSTNAVKQIKDSKTE